MFLVLGCFADLRGFRSWFLKGPSFTQCKCLDLPVVSPSLNACGCWWQGNRCFCYQQDACLQFLCGSPTSSRAVAGTSLHACTVQGVSCYGTWMHCCPSPLRKAWLGAGQLSSMPCSDFPSNSRKPHTLEDARQIHPKF